MDKLKKFIDTNRDAFDDEKLPEGHFDRFDKRLSLSERATKVRLYSLFAAIAAACVMLLLFLTLPSEIRPDKEQLPIACDVILSHVTSDTLHENKEEVLLAPKQQPTAEVSDDRLEIKELHYYYMMQINEILSEMQALYKTEQTPGASDVLKESKRILTDNFMFEQTVLPTLPASNAGLYAMTQHYNTSLEGLSIMLRQMKRMTNKEIN